MGPIDQLREEHQGVLLMLEILESMCDRMIGGKGVDRGHVGEILDYFRVFVDMCHYAKEEDGLFPAMVEAGVPRKEIPIGTLLLEHEEGRNRIRGMTEALADFDGDYGSAAMFFIVNAHAYADLLRLHIRAEDDLLFPVAAQRLTGEMLEDLVGRFERLEAVRVGPGRHEALRAMMDGLREIYLESPERRAG